MEDVILYLASAEHEHHFGLHTLEILSLMFREQVCAICSHKFTYELTYFFLFLCTDEALHSYDEISELGNSRT